MDMDNDFVWSHDVLKEGEWVKIKGGFILNGATAFILAYDFEDDRYKVQLTRDRNGEQTEGVTWIEADRVYRAEMDIDEDFLLGLIDTTLTLKQKDWFLELTSQLPQNNG